MMNDKMIPFQPILHKLSTTINDYTICYNQDNTRLIHHFFVPLPVNTKNKATNEHGIQRFHPCVHHNINS